jgi:hypothetical protein
MIANPLCHPERAAPGAFKAELSAARERPLFSDGRSLAAEQA